MKKGIVKFSVIVLIASIFTNCCSVKKNVEVSNFIKHFIIMYINDELNNNLSPKSHIIKVTFEDNTNEYSISVIGYEKQFLTASDTSYFGYSKIGKYDVYFYGIQISKFVTVFNKESNKNSFINLIHEENNIEYDPTEFKISLFNNYAFDKMHSFKGNIYNEVSDLKYIADKYVIINTNIIPARNNDEIYTDVQKSATFEAGMDSLLSIVYHDPIFLKTVKRSNCTFSKVTVNFIVTKEGKVINPKILQGSGNDNVDKTIEKIVSKFPNLLPAEHRGEIVNSFLAIPINIPK